MTLDILAFIPEKDGNPELIRESQRKRGDSVEVVDEVIELYKNWVKRKSSLTTLSQGKGSCKSRSRL